MAVMVRWVRGVRRMGGMCVVGGVRVVRGMGRVVMVVTRQEVASVAVETRLAMVMGSVVRRTRGVTRMMARMRRVVGRVGRVRVMRRVGVVWRRVVILPTQKSSVLENLLTGVRSIVIYNHRSFPVEIELIANCNVSVAFNEGGGESEE
eukprot:TRINITY_DN395_c0_g1_i1.p2 TRINITY_DN395_c0_g1~~TRINITY_DN395_c0_g1_i1.p2  ORF type:complete len:149 (-),score=20.15 TRINITY_DN395_c0_g1_i1:125-571(-)